MAQCYHTTPLIWNQYFLQGMRIREKGKSRKLFGTSPHLSNSWYISSFSLHWILGKFENGPKMQNVTAHTFILRLTMSTELYISDQMKLVDTNGYSHELTPLQVRMMMAIGWLSFFLSWIMNISFYAVHPSMVDFNLMKMRGKCSVYILGRKIYLFDKQGKS